MKGHISLKDFIKSVKEDLKSALDTKNPFFHMDEVELEVSFILDAEAQAGARFLVVDIGGKTKASQCHKVRMKLIPFVGEEIVTTGPQGSSKKVSLKKPPFATTHPEKRHKISKPTLAAGNKPIVIKKASFPMPKTTKAKATRE